MKPSLKSVKGSFQKLVEKLVAKNEVEPEQVDVEALTKKFMQYYNQVDFPSKEKFDESVYLVFDVSFHVDELDAYEKPLLV